MGPGISQDWFPHAFGGNINTPDSNGIGGASEHGHRETATPADSPDNNGGYPRPWEWGGSGGGDDRKRREKENKKIIQKHIPNIDAETLEDWGSIMTDNQERKEKRIQDELNEKKRQKDLKKEWKKREKQNKQKK